jgi:hypothetical protein
MLWEEDNGIPCISAWIREFLRSRHLDAGISGADSPQSSGHLAVAALIGSPDDALGVRLRRPASEAIVEFVGSPDDAPGVRLRIKPNPTNR